MFEIWKRIYNNYSVSNLGNIRRDTAGIGTFPGRILKPYPDNNGYLIIDLNGKTRKVHSLVAEAFIGKRPKGLEVNHKDLNKNNCKVGNLEYVTHKDNMAHWARISGGIPLRKGEDNNLAKLTKEKVIRIRKMYKTGNFRQWELAKIFKVDQTNIGCIVRRVTWKHI